MQPSSEKSRNRILQFLVNLSSQVKCQNTIYRHFQMTEMYAAILFLRNSYISCATVLITKCGSYCT